LDESTNHLRGAAKFLQICHPSEICSTALGLSLLDWFAHYEDCLVSLGKEEAVLDHTWRERRKYVQDESPDHGFNGLQAQFRTLSMDGNRLIMRMSRILRTSNIAEGAEALPCLEMEGKELIKKILDFMASPKLSVFEIRPSNSSQRLGDSPDSPSCVSVSKFPEAGFLRLACISYNCVISSKLSRILYLIGRCQRWQQYRIQAYQYCEDFVETFDTVERGFENKCSSMLPALDLLLVVSACAPYSKQIRDWFLKMIGNVATEGYTIDAEFEKKLKKEWEDLDNMKNDSVYGRCKCCLGQLDLGRSYETAGIEAGAQ